MEAAVRSGAAGCAMALATTAAAHAVATASLASQQCSQWQMATDACLAQHLGLLGLRTGLPDPSPLVLVCLLPHRSRSLLHMQSLNNRCRELHTQLKHRKRELHRARKTVRTLEVMAMAVGSGAAPAAAAAAATATATATAAAAEPAAPAAAPAGVNVVLQTTGQQQQQQQQQVPVLLAGSQLLSMQQQMGNVVTMTAGVSCTCCRHGSTPGWGKLQCSELFTMTLTPSGPLRCTVTAQCAAHESTVRAV